MKNILLMVGILGTVPVWAQEDVAKNSSSISTWQMALYAALAISCLLLFISYYLLKSVRKLEYKVLGEKDQKQKEYEEAFQKQPFWSRLFQLLPLSVERDALIDENYDGIQELNNPTPPWFMWLFYLSIIAAFFYWLNYHVFQLSPLSEGEYKAEMAQAESGRKKFLKDNAINISEDNVKLSDKAGIDKGGKLFATSCVPCHGDKGQGTIGPNLTDNMWLHGGNLKEIFHTISEGVPAKGMVSWKSQLNPQQIQDVASFVFELRKTPASGKAPEGKPFEEEKAGGTPTDTSAKAN